MYAVFRDDNSHCCIRVSEVNGLVEYIALFEEGGAIRVDLFKANGREFYDTYNHELTEYPIKRAAKHFMNPLTSAIEVTSQAKKHLSKILESNMTNEVKAEAPTAAVSKTKGSDTKGSKKPAAKKVPVTPPSPKAEQNVEQTLKASIKTGDKPAAAPAKTVAGKEPKRAPKAREDHGYKATQAEENLADNKRIAKEQGPVARRAAKKVAKKIAKANEKTKLKAAKAAAAETNPTTEENTMATTKKAAAKKVVAKKAPAKKTTRGTGKGAAKAAAKSTVKATNAKKKEGGKRGRTSKYTEDMKIKVLATENPKRAGSEAYKIFELLKKSKTVGDFYAKGGGSHNLRWNEEREYIKVG